MADTSGQGVALRRLLLLPEPVHLPVLGAELCVHHARHHHRQEEGHHVAPTPQVGSHHIQSYSCQEKLGFNFTELGKIMHSLSFESYPLNCGDSINLCKVEIVGCFQQQYRHISKVHIHIDKTTTTTTAVHHHIFSIFDDRKQPILLVCSFHVSVEAKWV